MPTLNIRPGHKAVRAYYEEIHRLSELGVSHEGAVSPAFASLLRHCGNQFDRRLVEKYSLKPNNHGHTLFIDGALVDSFNLVHGFWEAKDISDDFDKAIKRKFDVGYPKHNILFQTPNRVVIWRGGREVFDTDISKPESLIEALKVFFEYEAPAIKQWKQAVEEFKLKVRELANGLLSLIERERQTNSLFVQAFTGFVQLCQETINPNIRIEAVEEMLIQHLLTERIFRNIFQNPDFVERNVIAREIEKVISALTSQYFSRNEFLKPLDRFYIAIETTAATIDDFSQKQSFLNAIYEKFFQGFSVKVADTLGIVYTPQPIVQFMVRSIEHILQKEFARSLSDQGVHIIDPFVGTGSFILWTMREIQRSKLPYKYANELHCNEVMLLPYYIASMNVEHEYYEVTGKYKPFEGICLVDTFDLTKVKQLSYFTKGNTERVKRQLSIPIFVVMGNPPYNAGQVNENDNNKNRKYEEIDKRVSQTYGKGSKATLLRKLNDPYVKAIRWASDKIGDEGIVAFVTNNSFLSDITFDGMRKCLQHDFNCIYILDLGGNVRKNPKLSGTTHNVFGIQVGVSINFFVKTKCEPPRNAEIHYARLDEFWRKVQKYDFLNNKECIDNVELRPISPDSKGNWLIEGWDSSFDSLMPIGIRETGSARDLEPSTIFKSFSLGVSTNRDSVVYSFDRQPLEKRVSQFCDYYNAEVARYEQKGKPADIDGFLDYLHVKWSSTLKNHLRSITIAEFDKSRIREACYRPFTRMFLYYDRVLIDRPGLFGRIFPDSKAETENRVICLSGVGSSKPFQVMVTSVTPSLDILEKTQCFPLSTYAEDGTDRKENITDWSLAQFREHYKDSRISKWDIFHYAYAILHHPQYRKQYAANLKGELPRIPFAPVFWDFANAGKRLAELHANYEGQNEFPLKWLENKDAKVNYRVERMALSRDKTQIVYNDFLTLSGIPPEIFEYRLGNRSALEWVIDQYQVSTDKRSGLVKDPNKLDDPQYIVRLIGKIITISLETVKIIISLPELQ
jgi:predicted helicase